MGRRDAEKRASSANDARRQSGVLAEEHRARDPGPTTALLHYQTGRALRYHCRPCLVRGLQVSRPVPGRAGEESPAAPAPKLRPVNNTLRKRYLSLPRQPFAVFASFWNHRTLILILARRDVVGRYNGSFLGLMWSFFNPLLMLGVYTLVFGLVFKARWGTGGSTACSSSRSCCSSGLLVYGIFSESVNRAPGLVLDPGFVKRVVFPLEILPWVGLCSSLFHAASALLVLGIGDARSDSAACRRPRRCSCSCCCRSCCSSSAFRGRWPRSASTCAMSAQTVNIVTAMMMFVSPIFYPATAVPEEFRWVIDWNPMAFFVEQARHVLIWGQLPDFAGLAASRRGGLASPGSASLLPADPRGFSDVL